MKKSNGLYFLLFFLFFALSFSSKSQAQRKVSGNVLDSLKKPVEGVNIQLITGDDTLKVNSNSKGNFSFNHVRSNKFYIYVSGIGYRSFITLYEVNKTEKNIVLDPILIKAESITLKEVEVKVKVDPIVIKKDTVEYNAAAYTIRQNDKVEDLLKQLQGVEVDANGAVTAMGKPMNKLRVNGEDFFTGNVQDYIRQLPADVIAKLQVIEDYGDEANFTGIKNGPPQKMLNLVTKPGMNKGVFGNLDVNSATSNAHNLNFNGNLWKESRQIGLGANYGFTNNEFTDNQNRRANANIRNKISKELIVNGGYTFSNANTKSIQSSYLETFNPLGVIYDLRQSSNNARLNNNSLNLGLNLVTKKNYLNMAVSGVLNNNRTDAISSSNKSGYIKQDLFSNSGSAQKTPNFNGNVNWSRKLLNAKKSLSASINFGRNKGTSNSTIEDIIKYYNETTNILVKDSLLNRLVNSNTLSTNFGGNIQFANSLNTRADSINSRFLTFSYRFGINKTKNLQTTTVFDQAGNGKEVDSLGLDYASTFINQTINLSYSANNKNLSYSFGFSFMPSIIIGKYEKTGERQQNFQLNFSPSANLSYLIKDSKSLSFGYNGYANAPDFNKLQPVKNTSDVQNIVVGNPDLKATATHIVNLDYNQNNLKSGFSLMLGLSGTFTFNSVVNNTIFLADTLNSLKQQTTYENVNGVYNIGGNYSIFQRFMDNKLSLSYSGSVAYSHNVFYTDNVLNKSGGINLSNGARLSLNKEKYSINAGANYSYSSNTYSVQNQNIKNIQVLSMNFGGTWIVSPKFRVNTTVSKSLNLGFNINNGNPFIMNLGINQYFLKNNRLSFSVQANDLFNQGALFRTSVNNNSISENRTRFISRFVQASLSYNINNFGGKRVNRNSDVLY
ncbi:outer membrane beta-barrel protein [Pedobacter punctiformis]|uniref:Outer membrane beta-barrel protein n=1 Tax=Pedobacter punctiformis TaxID=3004097 RepID=A0ABT4LCP7_9SPHI|nr:outer membrane beta-barrel protein [Pedobacter sp. HCMS5-2]MCZ4245698.1 outer membrane beta-barrel protein [Pedobacter sp. HCMS5-2]